MLRLDGKLMKADGERLTICTPRINPPPPPKPEPGNSPGDPTLFDSPYTA
jgi:hypothetical protein